ncbi:transcobalamin-2 isoform X1 [Pseudonaja textilis]|uniref:transcobalamin-2 isoform X1 n=1 Tax=Pseudonaja textilis TaxID=8673 RepID=UPI000EAABE49|nr:transcobalamin-2 isoform X1 [Pseudonaja textilis]
MVFPWLRLPFLLLFHLLFASAQLCEIPAGALELIQTLNSDLLKVAGDGSQEPNPSLYLALRLSSQHNLEKEREYLNRLTDVFQPQSSSPGMPSELNRRKKPGTGELALYLLAQRAACQDMDTPERNRMVTRLKLLLNKEMKQIGHKEKGHPITNYYQYSLGILALCIHNKRTDPEVIWKLLSAEHNGRFYHHQTLSVDTEAMAGLVFVCLEQSPSYPHNLQVGVRRAMKRAKAKILEARTPDGVYGNIYSSPLAVQFLSAVGMRQNQQEFSSGMAALRQRLERGDFQNNVIRSQLLPALYCKSYVDIASMACQTQTDSFIPDLSLSKPLGIDLTRNISIRLEVRNAFQLLYQNVLVVPWGSTLLDVLEAAAKDVLQPLRYETQKTLSGPMLTGVMGERPQEGERRYWRILRHPNSSLDQGIAEYTPQDGDHIILKMTSW